jgi:hypothetical protein
VQEQFGMTLQGKSEYWKNFGEKVQAEETYEARPSA